MSLLSPLIPVIITNNQMADVTKFNDFNHILQTELESRGKFHFVYNNYWKRCTLISIKRIADDKVSIRCRCKTKVCNREDALIQALAATAVGYPRQKKLTQTGEGGDC